MELQNVLKQGLRRLLTPVRNWLVKIIDERHAALSATQMLLLGQIRLKQLENESPENLQKSEIKIFSQGGEDGIIQKMLQFLPNIPCRFVEFGVQNYLEANTRFLVLNNHWDGLILDGSQANIDLIKTQEIYWQKALIARNVFITKDNIQSILSEEGFDQNLGLLSIDIDGNDYWIWQTIKSQPWIVVCEYNSWFGPDKRYSIPYQEEFNRSTAHYSNLFFGASIQALCSLAEEKGYVLVGADSMGTNVFFVRRDMAYAFKTCGPHDVYVQSPIRQARDANGRLTFLNYDEGRRLMGALLVYDFDLQRCVRFDEAEGLR